MDEADSVDREKLLAGLDVRTSCCHRHVPTDCMDGSCGHGPHELTDPITGDIHERDDYPCILYGPDNHVMYHTECPGRRSHHQAVAEAEERGGPRHDEEAGERGI